MSLLPRSAPSLLKGIVAGAVGGLAGTAVKSLAERIAPPRPPGREAPPKILVDDIAEETVGHELDDETEAAAVEGIHWTFGTGAGVAYGALAEVAPAVTAGAGTLFGGTFFLLTHESALPALGLTPPPTEIPLSEHANEFVTHLLFGLTVELVRRGVRSLL